jgi:hypothetical protein
MPRSGSPPRRSPRGNRESEGSAMKKLLVLLVLVVIGVAVAKKLREAT